jgi:2,5-diamino-6-(ribosylamino)-4(3H)-pyrimidinone 5'-phosphate reductase
MNGPGRFGKSKDGKSATLRGCGNRAFSGMPRPRLSTNLAISADGKITSVEGQASGWTSPEDHLRLLELRKDAGALLIGRGTLEADRMTMTVPESEAQPLRCIVSRSGALDPEHPIFAKEGGAIHLLVTGDPPAELPPSLADRVTLHHLTLGEFLEKLAMNYGVERIHCEGGGQLIRELAALDAIDDFHVTLAGHTLFGGKDARTATGIPADFLPESRLFELTHFEPLAEAGECFVTYTRRR